MKAVRLLEYGGQLVFNDVPTPAIARDETLVKIKSTAVNHLDLVKASGTARQILPIDLPWIPGHEFSGVVEQIGSDVAAYAPGDAVFAADETGGAYAEYLAVKPAAIARKPGFSPTAFAFPAWHYPDNCYPATPFRLPKRRPAKLPRRLLLSGIAHAAARP